MTPPKPCKFHRRFSPNKRVCSMTWESFTDADEHGGAEPSKDDTFHLPKTAAATVKMSAKRRASLGHHDRVDAEMRPSP